MAKQETKVSKREFVLLAIKALRTKGYKGIHSVYSKFMESYMDYFDVSKAQYIEDCKKLEAKGIITQIPAKGGVMIYLPSEAPERGQRNTAKTIAKILGDNQDKEEEEL